MNQEMARVNVDILGINELKWTGMGEFNSHDYIYYCRQESFGRNGVDLTEEEDIKKRWQEYTEELYKKDFHDPDNHDGVITPRARHPGM